MGILLDQAESLNSPSGNSAGERKRGRPINKWTYNIDEWTENTFVIIEPKVDDGESSNVNCFGVVF